MSGNNDADVTHESPLQVKKSWIERIVFIAGMCLLLIVIFYIGLGIRAAYTALDAEKNMQTSRCVIQLVEEFVKENRRWPGSWKELEAMKPSEQLAAMLGPWPGSAEEVKKRVLIDFQPDLKEIVRQDRYDFTAIKPIGSHYEYRRYGDVDELQKTMRLSISGLRDK